MSAGLGGLPRNRQRGALTEGEGRGGVTMGGEKGRVAALEWAKEGREKRAMDFTGAKYLKRRERRRGWAWACG